MMVSCMLGSRGFVTDGAARAEPNLFELCRNIVQTRAESSLLGYAECSRYSTKLIVTEEDN